MKKTEKLVLRKTASGKSGTAERAKRGGGDALRVKERKESFDKSFSSMGFGIVTGHCS